MWRLVLLSLGVCTVLSACGGGGGGSNGGGNSGGDTDLLAGTPVAVIDTLPTSGDTLILEEVDTEYVSQVHGTTHSNGTTFYLAPESSQITQKNSHSFTPGYFISEGEICLSTADFFNEIRVNISYDGDVTSDVLLRPCGLMEVDFTAFPNADLVMVNIATVLLAKASLTTEFPFGPSILPSQRDDFVIASEYLIDFDTDAVTGSVRFFPAGLLLVPEIDNWTYVPAFVDRTSGHICVSEVVVGGYMMAYDSRDSDAVDIIGDRLILDLFSAGSALNPEAMIYWGARCE